MSIASSSFRIDWRPSRQLCLALLGLGALGAASVWLSELALPMRVLLSTGSLAYGAWLARREWRRPRAALEFDGGSLNLHLGTQCIALAAPSLRLRGPLASVEARGADGRRRVLLWSADTLPAPARRQLRLRLGGQSAA